MPEASEAARMSTKVLPSSTAPIIFAGWRSSRLTRWALELPSCSSACMRAREAAVSAVSLALKNADSTNNAAMAARMRPTSSVMVLSRFAPGDAGALDRPKRLGTPRPVLHPRQLIARSAAPVSAAGDLAGEEIAHDWCWNIGADKGLADGARQDQGQFARPHLLVLAHDAEQGFGFKPLCPRNVGDRGGQAASAKVPLHAGNAVPADMAQCLGEPKRQADA